MDSKRKKEARERFERMAREMGPLPQEGLAVPPDYETFRLCRRGCHKNFGRWVDRGCVPGFS